MQAAGPRQSRPVHPVYVGCVHFWPPSKEKYTPETPTPGVNGHVVGSPALHASMSISSFEPATTIDGWAASIATAGSFCLFCENGDGGLPFVTSVPVVGVTLSGLAMAVPAPASTRNSTAPTAANLIVRIGTPLYRNERFCLSSFRSVGSVTQTGPLNGQWQEQQRKDVASATP